MANAITINIVQIVFKVDLIKEVIMKTDIITYECWAHLTFHR